MGKKSVHLIAALALAACTRSTPPAADHASSSSAGTASASASCGELGGACTKEGASCSPAPVGTGWSHMLTCRSGKWTEMEIAPLPQTNTEAPRVIPKLDATCNADADCVVITEEIQDDPPRTWACCGGCTQRAASTSWNQQFSAACAASPPKQCPPLGCAMQEMRAVCRDHRCSLTRK